LNSDLQFEWDKEKEKANRLKHNVSFEAAKWVFRDDFRIEYFDEAHSKDEDRFITIGLAGQTLLVLFVVYTERDDTIRIISARKADATERRRYYDRKVNFEF